MAQHNTAGVVVYPGKKRRGGKERWEGEVGRREGEKERECLN